MKQRSVMLLSIALLASMAYGVFHIKHRVKELTKDAIALNRQIATDKEAIHVLEAEWAYLVQPLRIKMLAQQYMDLDVVKVSQVKKGQEVMALAFANAQELPMDHDASIIRPLPKPVLASALVYE
tara:strand:+ start:352 stop:726 length:375 start_codon:yes stop_codon:yes gene_type:complete